MVRAGLSFHPESHWSQSYYDRRCQVLKSQEVCVLSSTEGSSWCPHGRGHRYKVFPCALPTLPDGSSQERDMLTPLADGDAPLPFSPPPPRSRATPSQEEVRPPITLCPFSSPLLGSDLIFRHFTMKEKPWCQPTMYLMTSHDRHCKPPERGAAAWAALGTPWCLEEISPHQGCIPSPTPHWVHKHLLMKLMELNLLTPQASFLRPERQYLLGSCLPSCFTAAGIRPGMGRSLL